MKRLLKKINRLKRKITAGWQPIDVNSPETIQIVTDAMAMQQQIQIEYQGSGWRLILPYGWNSSQQGNILLMCYKDTGEVRSYRLDRVLQILVDDSLLQNSGNDMSSNDQYQVDDYKSNPENFQIPNLPNIDEILEQSENEKGQKLPYDDALDILTNPDMANDVPEQEDIPNDNEQSEDTDTNKETPNEEENKSNDIDDKKNKDNDKDKKEDDINVNDLIK